MTAFVLAFTLLSTLMVAGASKSNRPRALDATPIVIGESLKIKSRILGEEREVHVYVPPSYAKSTQRYPVIYTTDGETTFMPTASAVQFITSASELPQMPEALVVSVRNTDRMRDMPIPEEYNMGRGEENFLAFIGDELIPAIEKRYRTQPLRIYIGHSQGGTFGTYALSARPQLFQWYVPLDGPLYGFEKLRQMMKKAKTTITNPAYRGRVVSVEGSLGWLTEWKSLVAAAPKTFYGAQVKIDGESHQTMVYKGIYEGLKHLFHDYAPDSDDAKVADLEAKYKALSALYGYRVDIPGSVLTNSANRNVLQENGAEAIKLIQRAVALYGSSPVTTEMLAAAEEVARTGRPDPRVVEYLNSPKPSLDQMKPFLGTWSGTMTVPEGVPLQEEITFEVVGNEVRARAMVNAPGTGSFPVRITFIRVIDDRNIQWGGPNGRIGLNLNTATLVDGRTLKGKQESLGVRRNPNRVLPPDPTFVYTRQ